MISKIAKKTIIKAAAGGTVCVAVYVMTTAAGMGKSSSPAGLIAFIFLAFAWFGYLKYDGVKVNIFKKADDDDDDDDSPEEIEIKKREARERIFSSLCAGIVFVIVSVIEALL